MPTDKTREEFIDEMKYSLGLKDPSNFSEEDLRFFEELDKIYGDTSYDDLEIEIDRITKEIPQKKNDLKALENRLTDEITKKIENDIAAHTQHRSELIPEDYEERMKGDRKAQREALLEEQAQLFDEMNLAESRAAGYSLEIDDIEIPGLDNILARCEHALESSDLDDLKFDEDFWKTKFGYVFEEEEGVTNADKLTIVLYMEAKAEHAKLQKETSIVCERINAIEKNQKEYYGKFRDEWKKEDKILDYLNKANAKTANIVGTPVTVEGVTFDYTCAGNDPEYAAKKKELDDLDAKKRDMTKYLTMRKALGKRPSDIDGEKFKTSFKKYYDAEKNYNKLSAIQKILAHILSGSFYEPAAIKRERDAYHHALKEVGLKDEEIDAKVQQIDNAQAAQSEEAKPETTAPPAQEKALIDESNVDFYEDLGQKTKGDASPVKEEQPAPENANEKKTDLSVEANTQP